MHGEDKDYKTAYSYFYEAFEAFDSLEDHSNAVTALKYMLLCKIMGGLLSHGIFCYVSFAISDTPKEVHSLIAGKYSLKYGGKDVASMAAIADSCSARSLRQFNESLEEFADELKEDVLISRHLNTLYDKLLEQNLLRIVEPFSVVHLHHVSSLIDLPCETVERKLSQMILDKTFSGVLDQEHGMLVVFEEQPIDPVYPHAIEIIQNMGNVLDALYEKATQLK
ncbi:PCI domain-containing protein [Patescibacteria group bacterium]|nr:PCI domain-containing protein [Patescibacteria group bacterium]